MQPTNFPYKEEIMSVNPTCLVVIILLFISIILAFKVSTLLCIQSTSGHGWNVLPGRPGFRRDLGNYRPGSVTAIQSKVIDIMAKKQKISLTNT